MKVPTLPEMGYSRKGAYLQNRGRERGSAGSVEIGTCAWAGLV